MDQSIAGVLGIDMGSVNIKAAFLPQMGARDPAETQSWTTAARGQPLLALEDLLAGELGERVGRGPLQLSLTGIAQDLLSRAVPARRVNEVVATALAVAESVPGTRTVIDVGGQFTKWILLDGARVADFAVNGLCAAGSGAFLEQQAARLKLTADEMGRLAATAERGATVAGRCSVFAKSDMIHLQQKGTPVEEIAYGVCLALVRTFVATVLGGRRVEAPVVLVGGGGANPGLVRAFTEVLGLEAGDVTVPADHLSMGARGAALAAEASEDGDHAVSRDDPLLTVDELLGRLRATGAHGSPSRAADTARLRPLGPWADHTPRPDEDPPRETLPPGRLEVYLGIDVGSVSTNIVVLSPEGELYQGIYLPTRGRPIEVLDEALTAIKNKFGDALDVLAVGATGSGRHLAARALGADTVKNEITAQMASAAYYFPDVDTVFEIGGQDSKYIGARDGHLASFEMNKICAAGTGSFLEEQAERLGVRIKGEFATRALEAEAPRDLGSRCTVFMDTELVRAQQQGASTEDICAGLAYSIARNYLEKVVAHREVGETVVFQGGTASNEAVVAATRALTGKRIVVHPYNRVSGAMGAALLAGRDAARSGVPSRFRGYESCRGAKTRSFECGRCSNRCQVIKVEIGGQISHFGDTCERFSARDGTRGRGAAPRVRDLFKERAELLERHLPPRRPGRPHVVLPRASQLYELAPFWAAALDALGYDVELGPAASLEIIARGGRGLPHEFCLPVKVEAGLVRQALAEIPDAQIVAPSVLEMPDPARDHMTHPCLFSQEVPNILAHEQGSRLVVPQCSVSRSSGGLREARAELQRLFGASRRAAKAAVEKGLAAQDAFDQARRALGREALAEVDGRAVVVLGRPYNVHDPLLNLDLSRRLRQLGLLAIPMDLLPLSDIRLGPERERIMWRYTRDQLRALELIRGDDRLFPLFVSCFGCGVDAFGFKHVEEVLGDRPSLMLEFDEHRGEAGLVTRLEAFFDEIEEHLTDEPAPRPAPALIRRAPGLSGRVVVPNISDHALIVAAAVRLGGYEAEVLPPPDDETLELGEKASSGGECHPWVVMTGELIRWATSPQAMRGDIFYYPQALNPCLIGQYGDGHRRVLRRLGLGDRYHVMAFHGAKLIETFGGHSAMRMYEGIAAVDLLLAAACARRPYEVEPGSVDAAYWDAMRRLEAAIAAGRDALDAVRYGFRRILGVRVEGLDQRPVVGVCGDLYTRINPYGNAELYHRLESLGCQVWPHTYLSGLIDQGSRLHMERWAHRGQLGRAALEYLTAMGGDSRSRPLRDAVPAELRRWVLTPTPDEMRVLASPYVGPRTNNLITENVARTVDFIQRGADGVISAIGVGCMMGVSVDGALSRIRADNPDVPIVTLAYSCAEGPSQRIKLETLVHQVHDRFQARSARQ